MVRYLPSREVAGKRERLKILSRHTRINQPVYRFEPEATIVTRLTKHYTARCTHCLKSGERTFHELRADTAPLMFGENRYWTKPKPAGCTT